MTPDLFTYTPDPHCKIGRIRFKHHRGRERRKDATDIKDAKATMTQALQRLRVSRTIEEGR